MPAILDLAGGALGDPGDMNGDGCEDLAIGAYANSEVADQSGKIYFLFGRPSGWSLQGSLAAEPSVVGQSDTDQLSQSARIGDVNGDGLADLAMWYGYSSSGAPDDNFVVLGKRTGWSASQDVTTVEGHVVPSYGDPNAFWAPGDLNGDGHDDWLLQGVGQLHAISGADVAPDLVSPADDLLSLSGAGTLPMLAGVGDFDGDGLSDLLIRPNAWDAAWIVFGATSGLSSTTHVEAAAGVTFSPSGYERLQVEVVGDVDGDGRDDIAIMQYTSSGGFDGLRLFLGRATWPAALSADQADAWIAPGSGLEVNGPVGDLDGDGVDDLAISVYGTSYDYGPDNLYLYRGRTSWPASLDLTDADTHIAPTDVLYDIRLPDRPQQLGDLNGDGLNDLLILSYRADWDGVADSGVLSFFLGRAAWEPELDMDDADLRVVGTAEYDYFGYGWRTALADLNGDGRDDLITTSPSHPYGDERGEVLIYFGQAGP